MSNTPRASGFWETHPSRRMGSGYFSRGDEAEDEEQEALLLAEDDGRTPLDRTIDKIGMGAISYLFLPALG